MDKYERQIKIYYIMIVVSIIMIISGGISSLILDVINDKDVTSKRVIVVKDEYEDFSTLVSLFEDYRDNLYGEVLNNMTYDNMYNDYNNTIESLSNYEAMVDEIYKETKSLDKLCDNVYYPDSKANSICNNYKSIYEQVNNYYVSDINSYNNIIDNYNTYISTINNVLVLDKFNTKKNYIDFDKDGKKIGSN